MSNVMTFKKMNLGTIIIIIIIMSLSIMLRLAVASASHRLEIRAILTSDIELLARKKGEGPWGPARTRTRARHFRSD